MYTKFYDNTIITKFVKELVAKTNVPFISTWKPGDFAIRGMLYLTKDAIWKCLHTGWPKNINDSCPAEDHIATRLLDPNNEEALRFFTRVSPYVFGEEYFNITGRYESKILGYDNITHFYLGLYLRMMRDLYNLDLMPLYNCFGGEYVADIDFNDRGEVFSAASKNSAYKILSVPVRFGLKYMLAVNSEVPVECICAIYSTKGFIKKLTDNLNSINSEPQGDDYKHNTYLKFQRTEFLHPVLYKTVSWHLLYQSVDLDDHYTINSDAYDQGLGQFEKYLRLLIKIPKTNKSSAVVIEGDYSAQSFTNSDYDYDKYIPRNASNVTWSNAYLYNTTINSKTVTGEWIRPERIENSLSQHKKFEKPLFSPLSLLQISDGNIYAFSDRLIEYLTQNVINHLDDFTKDIERVQTYSKSDINFVKNGERYSGDIVPGVWDINFLRYLFDLVKESNILDRKIDLTGYVDKDTELVITRGQGV